MADPGINIGWGAKTPATLIAGTGARLQRVVARREIALTSLLRALGNNGIRTLMVYDRGSFEAFGSVEPDHLAGTAAQAFAEYARRYNGLVFIHQPGNESDHESPSSWTQPIDQVVMLGRLARQVWPDALIATPGLASGQPGYLAGADLSWADMTSVHPYGKMAAPGWPHPDWGTGELAPLLDGYAAYGKPLLISEIGLPVPQVDEAFQAEYCGRMMATLNARPDVLATCWFALTDDVPGFGLYRADGSARPAAGQFKAAAASATPRPWPTPGGKPIEPPVEPSKPTGWEWWDARTIAATIRCPEAAVREHAPRLADQLNLCGLYEMPIMAAMLGTVAIETAHQFQPIHEFRNADGSIPDIWWTYEGGPTYHGRGFIQLTHLSNYRSVGWAVADLWGAGHVDDFDWVAHPDNALQPDNSAAAAACYFRDHGGGALPPACRAQNWREVRRLVQGGSAGLGDFTLYASTLVSLAGGTQPEQPTDWKAVAQAYEVALKTLRDETLPAAAASITEAQRIVEQMVGKA